MTEFEVIERMIDRMTKRVDQMAEALKQIDYEAIIKGLDRIEAMVLEMQEQIRRAQKDN